MRAVLMIARSMKGPYTKLFIDVVLWSLALVAAYYVRLEAQTARYLPDIALVVLLGLPVKAVIAWYLGFNSRSWHRSGLRDLISLAVGRSEERRVGKECRCGWPARHQ